MVLSKDTLIKENRLKLYQQPHYRDVLDHVHQMLNRLDSARDVVAQANSNYLAGISVQAAIGANSTNEVMKRMSLIAFIFAPMTLVTSMFGMNVKVPFQEDKSTVPFWLILTWYVPSVHQLHTHTIHVLPPHSMISPLVLAGCFFLLCRRGRRSVRY